MEKPDLERFPLITPAGWANYRRIREHPHAPAWNHTCGNRLTAAGLQSVRAFAGLLQAEPPAWQPGRPPDWLGPFVRHCFEQVPLYRAYGSPPADFRAIPTSSRADLARAANLFIPDDQPVDEMVAYATSGTSGHPINVYWHPASSAMYVPLLQAALALHGAAFQPGPEGLGCVVVCFQKSTYTLVSVAPYLDHSGFAKINLNPAGWADPDDRVRFLDDLRPQVFNGDPLSFAELARLPLRARPSALISTAMHLSEGLRADLSERFACPVIDLYAMNEAGPLAARLPGQDVYELLQPRLYLEILDPQDQPCPPGARGEVALSGGFNPYIPLLRYRTGDYAALEFRAGRPVLVGLEGRPPVAFRGVGGGFVNNIDVTLALRPFPLEQFQLHQFAGGRLRLSYRGRSARPEDLRAALLALFGPAQVLELVPDLAPIPPSAKVVQYTSDLG